MFVIVMEYLHQKLDELSDTPNFNYHNKCEKLKIMDISFAYELFLFTRGDVESVQLVMERFHDFSKSKGLYANPSKCKMFCGGVEQEIEM